MKLGKVKITSFSKQFHPKSHYYQFNLSNGEIIKIELSSISQDVIDKQLANRLDFLMQKFNNQSDLVLSSDCKFGYCDRNCPEEKCFNPVNVESKTVGLKLLGITDMDTVYNETEHHLYFVFDDKRNFKNVFRLDETNELIVAKLRKLANDIEGHYSES